MPLEASYIERTDGILHDEYSFVCTNKDNVIIETVKKAEEDNSVIVRMYEGYNSKSKVTVTAGFDFKEVYKCDLLENNETKLEPDNKNVTFDIRNFEIVTLKFVR